MFDEPGLRGPCPVSEKDWLLMQVASAVAKFGQAMTKEAIMYGGTVSDDDLWFSELQKRVPDLKRHELRVNSALTVNTLPCEAPWVKARTKYRGRGRSGQGDRRPDGRAHQTACRGTAPVLGREVRVPAGMRRGLGLAEAWIDTRKMGQAGGAVGVLRRILPPVYSFCSSRRMKFEVSTLWIESFYDVFEK